jgi:glycosyltransferase involved in cell wall biosynthesis
MRRILIFSTAYYPFVGGAEIAIKEITDRLGGEFEFDLITAKLRRDLPGIEKIGNVNVYRIGPGIPIVDKLLLPWIGAFKAIRLSRKNSYVCFWAMMVTFASGAAYFANIILKFSGRKEIPIVLTLQEGDSEKHLKYKWGGLIDLSWRQALKRTRMLTAISTYLLKRAKSLGYKGESALIPNGVDIDHFTKSVSEEDREKIRSEWGMTSSDTVLITTSRLTVKNGIDSVISALTNLPKNYYFIIVGDGKEENKLRKLTEKIGVLGQVRFLGYVEHEKIVPLLKSADIYIRASRSEGMGNSFIEAMAAGIPVIATPVGGIVDFLHDGDTGLFVNVDDPESIAKQVNVYTQNPDLRDKIIKNAKEMVVEKYDWEKIVKYVKDKVFENV